MPKLRIQTISEQVAAHLRHEILRGGWRETMPGRNELASELDSNHKTVEATLRVLESEGLLVPQAEKPVAHGLHGATRLSFEKSGTLFDANVCLPQISGFLTCICENGTTRHLRVRP